jgi:hypothetical protein
MIRRRRARGCGWGGIVGVFGGARERDVDFLLREVLGLQEGDALLYGGAGDRGILEDCCHCQRARWALLYYDDAQETCGR